MAVPPPDGLLEVGTIGRPHGIRGEVYVDLVTDRTERLDSGGRLYAGGTWLTVVRSKPQQRRFLVVFDAITDRETAALHTGLRLYAPPIEDPDAVWVHQLVGATVQTSDGVQYGTCRAVVANPASDLIELDDGRLVPTVFVVEVIREPDHLVIIDPPAGLLDGAPDETTGDAGEA